MANNTAHLPLKDYQQLQVLLDQHFDSDKVRVLVFGSRATGQHRPDSDLDLVVISDEGVADQFPAFREALQYAELSVPVEAIPYEDARLDTVKRIEQEGILFWPNPGDMQVAEN